MTVVSVVSAMVVVVVVEGAVGTVVGETVVGVTVVVVVEGGTTVPFPQQLMDAFQCRHPPFAYTSHAATAVLADGS
jgi:hypothetical protein